jgi:hypothetical protein
MTDVARLSEKEGRARLQRPGQDTDGGDQSRHVQSDAPVGRDWPADGRVRTRRTLVVCVVSCHPRILTPGGREAAVSAAPPRDGRSPCPATARRGDDLGSN